MATVKRFITKSGLDNNNYALVLQYISSFTDGYTYQGVNYINIINKNNLVYTISS